ncbi:MAG TPA: translation initiation factor IF-2 [Kiloniellales bacterium]|nr:translation initiation factor IF-2 [Kiloniellales bacterium]
MTNETEKTSLKLRPGKLELKKTVETGSVRQSFSHGRTKTVTVEVKKKRTFAPGDGGRMTEVRVEEKPQARAEAAPVVVIEKPEPAPPPPPADNLTEFERQTRSRALEESRKRAEQRAVEEAAEARRRAEEEERRRQAEQEAAQLARAEAERHRKEEEARKLLEADEAKRKKPEQAAEPEPAAPEVETAPDTDEGEVALDELGGRIKKAKKAPVKAPARDRNEPRRRQGRLTISQALDSESEEERQRSLASVRRQREKLKAMQATQQRQIPSKVVREVVVPETITVQELANRMAERGGEVVKTLMRLGVMATINQVIDADTAELVVSEFGHSLRRVSAADVEQGLRQEVADETEHMQARPPVVTVMGHVDHGKTSLLDALRHTDVAAGEAGGITQHIGAYQVQLPSEQRITFIDTPGHAAFTAMRQRGATVTDIVVLVVAADDGIKEQTVEAINHARAAGVPIIVAINKMDMPGANAQRVRQGLLSHELVTEDMGGEVLAIEVSAKTGMGLDKLEEAILLQAELLDLKANPARPAEGVIIESKLEKGRGAVATVLVRSGTLHVGDIFIAGSEWGRVRALVNERGEQLDAAPPATPVEVLGLQGTPQAGDDLIVVENEGRAREVVEFRQRRLREKELAAQSRGTLEQMLNKIREGEARALPVVIKSDVHGSMEAIAGALEKLGNTEVRVQVLHQGVGAINESDVTLAASAGAFIIGFNVRANPQAREQARRAGVNIRYYSIIYEVVDDVKAALEGMLSPEAREKFLGYAEIRQIFDITRVGKIAGCMVTEGLVKRGARVRLLRDNVVIHDGTLKTLRRFKDEVREVQQGYECGMAFENYQDIKVGDRIECYEVEQIARGL